MTDQFDHHMRKHSALFLISLVQSKPKKLIKLQLPLTPVLLPIIFPLLCDNSDDFDEDISLQAHRCRPPRHHRLNHPKRLTYDTCMSIA